MSLRDTRDIGTAKIVMLGGGGGGGSYTAGSGISISNSVITNIRKGALTGVVDSISGNIAHTQITGARDTFAAGALILLQSEAAGTADNLRIQYGAQPSESQTFAIYDTSGTAASVTIASGDTVIMMIDNTGYRAIILNVLSASGGSSYAGLGIGKKTGVTSNVIDTDVDLHRAPIVGDRLLIYFDEKVTNPTGLKTYNNGTAVTSNLENAVSLYINAGWNILEFKNDGLLYDNCWVRKQNVNTPTTLSGLSDTLITSPSDGQMLVYDNASSKWKNKTAVSANTGTAVAELKKIQIGNVIYNADSIKHYDVSSISNGAINVSVPNAGHLDGEIIAVNTGANSGTTSSAWSLRLSDGQTIEALTMSKGGSAYTDAITANCLLFVKCDISNSTAVVLGIVGGGSDVSANGSGTPASYLNKLKIGSATYDASAIRPFSVAQIANNSVKIYVADIDQLDGKIIALSTGALTGTTSSAWSLNLVDTSGGAVSLDVDMLNADGTAFTDDISANELLFVAVDLTSYEGIILSVVGKSEDEIKTATGNPITLTDAVAGNAIEVSAEIVASQDLHGYDKPWVGGAGVNILPLTLANLKAFNTEGVWADNIYSDNGGTVTVATNGDNVTGITLNGTFTATTFFYLATSISLSSTGDYYLSGCPSGGGDNYRIDVRGGAEGTVHDDGAGIGFTVSNTSGTRYAIIRIGAGTIDNKVFRPQLEKGTVATPYATWSNICPISGFSSVVITDVDTESHTATVTVALGSTVYGGTLDLTSGELTITHANIASYNGETIGEPWISSLDEYTQGGTPTTGAQVVYTLTTPTTTTLTAVQLALVKGYNQLSCNSGDMEITYKASGLDALKERVDDLEDAVADLETELTVMSKTRYTITSSSWSASANASGYYTYSLTLTTLLSTSYAPNVYISGASDSAFSTDTEKAQFSYLDECNLSASNTLVLYAKTKPTSTFYVYVEGQNA